jgi:hypothetical protein
MTSPGMVMMIFLTVRTADLNAVPHGVDWMARDAINTVEVHLQT